MIAGVLKRPRATLEVVVRERRVWSAAGVVAAWAAANCGLTLVAVLGGDLRPRSAGLPPAALDELSAALRIFAPVSAFLLPFLWWIGISAMMLLATRLFGGRPDFTAMLAAVGAASVPWVAGYAIQLPVGVLQVLSSDQGPIPAVLGALALAVSLISLVWHAVLVVIGGRFAAGTGYRGAGAACALTGLGCATAVGVLVISVLTFVFTLSGAGQ